MSSSGVKANGLNGSRAKNQSGSGGGAGGTIQILSRSLKGESVIEAKGGDGSIGGGGGGSGGRLFINYADSYRHDA